MISSNILSPSKSVLTIHLVPRHTNTPQIAKNRRNTQCTATDCNPSTGTEDSKFDKRSDTK